MRDVQLLWALTVLFLARVLGQVLVAFAGVTVLPPNESWYSGLLPYPLLLPLQMVILALQVKLNLDAARGTGLLTRPRPRLGRGLRCIGSLYALAMVVRYLVTGTHAIPVAFHLVLAAYLLILARLATDRRLRPSGNCGLVTPTRVKPQLRRTPCRTRPTS
jgi:hypothetical protein